VDFEELGDGPAVAWQMWLAEMDAAAKAVRGAEGISINEIESVVCLEITPACGYGREHLFLPSKTQNNTVIRPHNTLNFP
jgi:hypothetical protein